MHIVNDDLKIQFNDRLRIKLTKLEENEIIEKLPLIHEPIEYSHIWKLEGVHNPCFHKITESMSQVRPI